MPVLLNAHMLLETYKDNFEEIEDCIFKKLKVFREKALETKRDVKRRLAHTGDRCTFDRTLVLDAGCWTIPHGPCYASVLRRDSSGSVVCTPVMTFQTIDQLEDILKDSERELCRELLLRKPRRVGSLRVLCTVNPGRLRYELVLAMPFSEKK